MTRGLELCNPGDIRISAIAWQGKMSPSRDAEFETFDCVENGIRAVAKILLTYFRTHRLSTIRQIITRYAPPAENDTAAYIENVCNRTGFEPDAKLNLENQYDLGALVYGILDQEQGEAIHQITREKIDEGVSRALV